MANNQRKYASLTTLQNLVDNIKTFFVSKENFTKANIGLGNVDNTSDANKPVSTAQQLAIDTALNQAKTYTDTQTSSLASTSSVTSTVSTHNTSTDAHNDIRALITDLTTKLNNFLNVDDETTDQLSEVLTLIENNKGTLESLTTSKVNVSDIVDNLTTNNTSKVLSAAQGVAIKVLIDALQAELDSHTHTVSDITDLTVDATELNRLDGVTSNVQAQLDEKADSTHTHSNVSLGQGHGDCYTSSSTTEKAVDIYGYEAVTGGVVSVKFIYSVPASATMNINSKGAKPIYYKDSAITNNIIKGGDTATFIYDGSHYHLISIDRWHEDIVDLQATDGQVRQVSTSTNGNFRLLLTPSFQTETTTEQTYFDKDVYLNPYYNKIYGVDIDGNAGSADKLNTDAGSVSQPVYFADGVPVVATDVCSKSDHDWTLIYDSGEIPNIANSISGIDVSGYTNIEVLVRCYNDGDSHTTRTGSAIFTAENGKTYQFPVWTNMFTKSINTTSVMAQFKLVDGWLVCPYASKLTGDIDIFDTTEGGTAGNLTHTGSGMMKCISPLSTLTISNLDQNSDYYFGMGSRVMVWGWRA